VGISAAKAALYFVFFVFANLPLAGAAIAMTGVVMLFYVNLTAKFEFFSFSPCTLYTVHGIII